MLSRRALSAERFGERLSVMSRRRWAARLGDALAGLVLLGALLLPDRLTSTDLGSFAGVPIELMTGAVVLLVLPPAARRPIATVLGLLLGLLTVLKLLDIGFYAALSRPYDLVLDWRLAGGAWQLLSSSLGFVAAILIVAVVTVVVAGLVILISWATRRLAGRLDDHPSAALSVVAALTAFWLVAASTGWILAAPYPVASRASTTKISSEIRRVRAAQQDQRQLLSEVASDRFAGVPGDRLLDALRGKRVMIVFVESYGRVALADPRIAATVTPVLDAGSRSLRNHGLAARSGYLTSSTAGGGSWLAHATLLSGLWIDNQRRYLTLMASQRLTLTEAFQHGGWRTVGVMPGVTSAWPEGSFYHYDDIYDSSELGYAGPAYGWSRVPDQYTLAELDRLTRRPGERPTATVTPLVSSHAPWSAVPPLVNPNSLADGSVYGAHVDDAEPPQAILTRDPARVRADYARSITYSLSSLISYLDNDPADDDLVVIMLGDHQPAPVVAGETGRDVPITVIARDREVLRRIDAWGWSKGLRPAPDAPVWRMDAFRDRFFDAFSGRP